MKGRIGIHPQSELTPGRYLLDRDGRLHPHRFNRFIRAVAAVTVREKVLPPPTTKQLENGPERHPDGDVMAEFASALDTVRKRKSAAVQKTKTDFKRTAQAHRRKPVRKVVKTGSPPALYAGPNAACQNCGVRSDKHLEYGCPKWRWAL